MAIRGFYHSPMNVSKEKRPYKGAFGTNAHWQSQTYGRTGKWASKKAPKDFTRAHHIAQSGIGLASAGYATAHVAGHAGHNKAAIAGVGMYAAGVGAASYGIVKKNKIMRRETGTKQHAIYGYKNVKSSSNQYSSANSKNMPTKVRTNGRVGRK